MDEHASAKFYDKIKKDGIGYAWKLVGVDITGGYFAPFLYHYSMIYNYSKTGYNSVDFKPWDLSRCEKGIAVGFGCFHFFLTREDGRKALEWMKGNDLGYVNGGVPKSGAQFRRCNSTYKVVKVSFKAEDFIAVGRVDNGYADVWKLNHHNHPHALCSKGFEFIK